MPFRSPALLAGAVLIAAATAASAQDVEYTLINSSSATVLEFYTSPVEDDMWGEDLLAMTDLLPGEQGSVLIADGSQSCVYDMLFLFDDGTELTDTVDICELASYQLTD
ncbi:hypothetical protein [Roseicyclus persicicus]|uniref:Argininosuccinate lyase n=1 Tax=Roseicyclus persicicus TaxID=2650661 RepID=A0A7X6H061_9RHOB|nr:hypothetical protein [Roseibacterium persicicum]NKX45571.1 hypothetical protein [Roseibacterium persicicum]